MKPLDLVSILKEISKTEKKVNTTNSYIMTECKTFLLTSKHQCYGKVKGGVSYSFQLEETKEITNQNLLCEPSVDSGKKK